MYQLINTILTIEYEFGFVKNKCMNILRNDKNV